MWRSVYLGLLDCTYSIMMTGEMEDFGPLIFGEHDVEHGMQNRGSAWLRFVLMIR